MNRWETSVKYCCLVLNIPQRLRKSPYRVENGLLRVFILNLLNVTMDKFFMDQTQTLLNIPFHLSISVPFMDQTNFVLNIPIYVSMFFPFSAPPRWMKRRSVRFSTISAPFSQPWRIFSSPPHDSGCKHEDLKGHGYTFLDASLYGKRYLGCFHSRGRSSSRWSRSSPRRWPGPWVWAKPRPCPLLQVWGWCSWACFVGGSAQILLGWFA